MARASYIYLVSQINCDLPIGAFTVKYEMVDFLRRVSKGYCMPERQFFVHRIPDGQRWSDDNKMLDEMQAVELDVLELLGLKNGKS